MGLSQLFVQGIAAAGLVCLLRDGSIFASLRAHAEARGGWFAELMSCRLCLTFQVGLWLAVGNWLFGYAVFASLQALLTVGINALAIGTVGYGVQAIIARVIADSQDRIRG